MSVPASVEAKELSKLKMVSGNEAKYPIVISDGKVMEWLGIGWYEWRAATPADVEVYPTVVYS